MSLLNGQDKSNVSCCSRLVGEFKMPMFAVQRVDGIRVIDVKACFAPKPTWRAVLFKLVLFAWTVSILVTDLLGYANPKYYLIYLTHWCHVLTILYSGLSLVVSTCPGLLAKQPPSSLPDGTTRPNWMICLTWACFIVAAVVQMTVTVLFWVLEYDYNKDGIPEYSSILKHGGFMVYVLMEGLVLNATPVRVKHLLLPETVAICYLIWTGLHAVFDIGNPQSSDNDPVTDDDAIYGSINWEKRPESSAKVAAITSFLVVPILFFLLWTVSAFCPCCGSKRRYLKKGADVETGSSSRYHDMET